MHRHYLHTSRLNAGMVRLVHEEARHLQTVLRVREGDSIELFDGLGRTAVARVAVSARHVLELHVADQPISHAPPACALTLWTCVCKGKRMDWMVEKAVELGVSRIVPVISARTIVRVDDEDGEGKTERWMRVAIEAARQSGSAWLPEISAPIRLPDIVSSLRERSPVFLGALIPHARPMREALASFRAPGMQPPAHAGWFVGPEGDFTPEEMTLLLDAGAIPVSLGKNILRAETAALWGLCVLGAEWL